MSCIRFWAMAFTLIIISFWHKWHHRNSYNFNVFSLDAVWAQIRTRYLSDVERMQSFHATVAGFIRNFYNLFLCWFEERYWSKCLVCKQLAESFAFYSGREGTFECKLYWYSKFYNHVVLYVGSIEFEWSALEPFAF